MKTAKPLAVFVKETSPKLFEWVLNTPLGIIGNISVQSFLPLYKCICFRTVRKVLYKIRVRENHRTIKRYWFYSSLLKIEFLGLFKLAF